MLTIFIVDGKQDEIYVTNPNSYSRVLSDLNIDPDKVTFQNVSFEQLLLIKWKKSKCIVIKLYK